MRDDPNGDIDRRVLPGPGTELSRLPPRVVLLGVLILVGLSLLLTVFYTVEADEIAVVQRFGKYVRQEEPGLHLTPLADRDRPEGQSAAGAHRRVRVSY